ncbi:hypothetical protein [Cohnella hashimotonis]|uniref:DUF2628 domain-containing protein n=1 Tax=Cohnella hashimotonis TaxID=2826895 RepID=A0ABT6TD22_9BACL|nr:hypothetical protein [Cohnella hashimotonis]MDI4644736.1 hypothetical protein [Cohnella hashimotonis]
MSMLGVTYASVPRPLMVAWWSSAFPGFGHFIINQYARGVLLTLTEMLINRLSRLNDAIVYTFCGRFDDATAVLHADWAFGYATIYLFTIWDSYRAARYQGRLRSLSAEEQPLPRMMIHPMEVQYIERKKPLTGFFYSLLFPGLGQLYNQRFCLAFYLMFWWWVYIGMSHSLAASVELLYGSVSRSTGMLSQHWFMFMPSVLGGAAYHAYRVTIEQNRLFCVEQREYLKKTYERTEIAIFLDSG